MNIIFLGGYFLPDRLKEIESNSKGVIQNAANNLQWSIIKGLTHFYNNLQLVTLPYIGGYPLFYKKSYFKSSLMQNKSMEINCIGTYHCVREFINLLKKSDNPRIVNFSTVAVPLELAGEIAYAASKSAVEAFTKILTKEISQFNITVNAIGPSPIETDLIARVPKEKDFYITISQKEQRQD